MDSRNRMLKENLPQSSDTQRDEMVEVFPDFTANIIRSLIEIGHSTQTAISHLVCIAVILDVTRTGMALVAFAIEIVATERHT